MSYVWEEQHLAQTETSFLQDGRVHMMAVTAVDVERVQLAPMDAPARDAPAPLLRPLTPQPLAHGKEIALASVVPSEYTADRQGVSALVVIVDWEVPEEWCSPVMLA